MSSRMFLSVREEKGLCYSIHTSTDQYSDTGVLSTHAGVDLRRVPEAIIAISEEYRRIAEEGLKKQNSAKAKSFLKGKLTLRMEDSEERASFWSTSDFGRGFSFGRTVSKIESVSREDVQDIARTLLTPEQCHLSLIGPFSGREQEFSNIISTMKQYLALAQKYSKKDSTKKTELERELVPFWAQMRFLFADGFPLSLQKKCIFEALSTNYSGFFLGNTNIRPLVLQNVNIWNELLYEGYKASQKNMRGKHKKNLLKNSNR